jgi:pimeloyl-ACP methyl ester carboxylesterase
MAADKWKAFESKPRKEQENMSVNNATSRRAATHRDPLIDVDSAWSGLVPVDDTALAVTDTGGPGRPVVYLNGAFSSQASWRRVIVALGTEWRHITYDERARGASKQATDYSFAACVRDVDEVLRATRVDRPLLVGWSYGAEVALHWATQNPDRVAGVVMVDGGYPWDYLATLEGDGRAQIRRMFRRLRWIMPLARVFGMAARMSAEEHAEINIELSEVVAASDPLFDKVTFPMRFVVASGASLGGGKEGFAAMRAALNPVLARNPYVQVSARVTSKHTTVVRKDSPAIASAIREVGREAPVP